MPIALITGSTEGVGKATAMELAGRGFVVVLTARDGAKAEAVKKEIAASAGSTHVDCLIADLKSLKPVHRLAEEFKQRYPRLDVLINNAGILAPVREVTEDGYESTFQVNYLSQFYLTQLLLDELRKSKQGRIVNLTSNIYVRGKFDARNLQGERRFSTFAAYAASKLFVIMSSIEFAQRLHDTNVTVNAVHPGIVRTQMMLGAPGLFRALSYLALPFALSPQEGAATSVYLATSPAADGVSGKYFRSGKAVAVRNPFNTPQNRVLLWTISISAVQQGPVESKRELAVA
jgi:NAD(P)-dependent dehydrogenase (short-subunit alcohol dehydrogenase family)